MGWSSSTWVSCGCNTATGRDGSRPHAYRVPCCFACWPTRSRSRPLAILPATLVACSTAWAPMPKGSARRSQVEWASQGQTRPKVNRRVLSREWQGRMETVMALENGFAWNGKAHASLSAVAFAITGTKWNGHRFFGLRDRQKSAVPAEERIRAEFKPDGDRGARTSSLRPSLAERTYSSWVGARP